MIKGAPYQCFETDTIYKGKLMEQEKSRRSDSLLNSRTPLVEEWSIVYLTKELISSNAEFE